MHSFQATFKIIVEWQCI